MAKNKKSLAGGKTLSPDSQKELHKIREAAARSNALWKDWQSQSSTEDPSAQPRVFKKPVDLKKIPDDGYLVLLLPVQFLETYYGPRHCLEVLSQFRKKSTRPTLDVIFLYGNPLLFMPEKPALQVRSALNSKILEHKRETLKLITEKTPFNTECLFFETWDHLCLSTDNLSEYMDVVKKAYREDDRFKNLVDADLTRAEFLHVPPSVIFEEVVLRHIIRQKLVEFPKNFVRKDTFRLLINLEKPLQAEAYQWQCGLLPQQINQSNCMNPLFASHYDFSNKLVYHFDEMKLD